MNLNKVSVLKCQIKVHQTFNTFIGAHIKKGLKVRLNIPQKIEANSYTGCAAWMKKKVDDWEDNELLGSYNTPKRSIMTER